MSDEAPQKPLKFRPFFKIFPAIASEGYCCIYGYLRLCKARGETKKEMASWLKISVNTLKTNYQLLSQGRHVCQKYKDCLEPIIQELEDPNPEPPSNTLP